MHTESDIMATMMCPVAVGQVIDNGRQDGKREIVTSVKNTEGEITVVTEVLSGEAGFYTVINGELVPGIRWPARVIKSSLSGFGWYAKSCSD